MSWSDEVAPRTGLELLFSLWLPRDRADRALILEGNDGPCCPRQQLSFASAEFFLLQRRLRDLAQQTLHREVLRKETGHGSGFLHTPFVTLTAPSPPPALDKAAILAALGARWVSKFSTPAIPSQLS